MKNDSGMYTEYTSGIGGVCELWDPDRRTDGQPAGSYWCGNASSGGWASVDKQCATTGTLQLPVGMDYDKDDPQLGRFAKWSNATGAIVHAWHSQSWFVNMWNVSSHDPEAGSMVFDKGGWQGARNWCSWCVAIPFTATHCVHLSQQVAAAPLLPRLHRYLRFRSIPCGSSGRLRYNTAPSASTPGRGAATTARTTG